jgi:NADH-quinone oxidoreductase subunit J
MDLYDIIFYLFALLTVGSAVVVVFTKNIIYSAFSLLFTFCGVAGLYVLLNADFLAVTQLLIYVGGILVLIIFGVMLTNKVTNVEFKTGTLQTVPAYFIVAIIAGTLCGIFCITNWRVAPSEDVPATTFQLGKLLMTDFLLPFEAASVVLLIALIGAVLIARRKQ